MSECSASYRGRFAPSPTGPLHMGSLIAALASYLDARYNAGIWLLRMDDLDPPREQAGAAGSILRSLQCHALNWDEDIMWQSRRQGAYEEALGQLSAEGKTFNCDCSRNPRGTCQSDCRTRQARIATPWATRIAVDADCQIEFQDQLQGAQLTTLDQELEDFVIKRKDGLYAYQLAVVVDDAEQNISHIVRGSDLMDSTSRQIFLQNALGLPTPNYCHPPVITNSEGEKLSKQHHAPTLVDAAAAENLRYALGFLQQAEPPGDLTRPEQIVSYACKHWCIDRVPRVMAVQANPMMASV